MRNEYPRAREDPRILRYFEENDVQVHRYTDLTDPSEGVF